MMRLDFRLHGNSFGSAEATGKCLLQVAIEQRNHYCSVENRSDFTIRE